LTEGGETDSAVEGTETLLADDGEGAVGGVAVLGDVEGVGHRVALSLETDLDHVHGSHDQDGLSDTSQQTSFEGKIIKKEKKLLVPGRGGAWESGRGKGGNI
jgi:hypothetical protein